MKDSVRLKAIGKLALVALLLFGLVFGALRAIASEDFATYTEVDPGSKITVTSDNISFVSLPRNQDAYVYIDKGADYFSDDFAVNLQVEVTGSTTDGWVWYWALANVIDDLNGIDVAGGDFLALGVYKGGSDYQLYLVECKAGTVQMDSYIISVNTPYYVTIARDEAVGAFGTLYCYVYDDVGRTNLVDTLVQGMDEKEDFRYMYGLSSHNSGTSPVLSGYSHDVTISGIESVAPTTETCNATGVEYNQWMDWFECYLNGNVTADGGGSCTASFFYRNVESGYWSDMNVLGTYTTSENFTGGLQNLESEETYEFFARLYNSEGYDDGDILEFTTSLPVSVPSMITYEIPMVKGSDNVTLYGSVGYDGNSTSNVTAGFIYKLISDNWTYSDNVTGLITGSDFNISVGSLVSGQEYQFRAYGVNDEGTGYGGIGSFILYVDLTAPVVVTGDTYFETAVDAYLSANITEHGGLGSWSCFEYRKSGDIPWLESHWQFISDNDTSQWLTQVDNLIPNRTYEYRGKAWHADIEGPPSKLTGYGDIRTFSTYEDIRVPVVRTDNATYEGIGMVWLAGTVVYGGSSTGGCWFQYREQGTSPWVDTETAYGEYLEYSFGRMVFDLVDEQNYEYRALAFNDEGTGYGTIKNFRLTTATGEDDGEDDGDPVVDEDPNPPPWIGFNEWLSEWGMDNPGGRWIAILVVMAGCFAGFYRSPLLRVVVPISIFGIGIVIGWIDFWIVILLALGVGLTLFGLFRKKVSGGSAQ